MILPPLPNVGNSIAGPLCVRGAEDVLAELPGEIRRPLVAPVRDALCAGLAAGFIEYEKRAARAAALVDPSRSTGANLRQIAEDRGVIPTRGESEASIRSRLFAPPLIVTPDAVVARVATVLSPYTSATPRMFEPELDGMFLCDGDAGFGFVGAEPVHQDRLYPSDASLNGGLFIPGSNPGGAWLAEGRPRTFVVVIPSLDGADSNFLFADDACFVTDGSEIADYGAPFVFGDTLSTDEIYQTVVSTVDSIKGQGISWTLLVDANV